jgi:hypothetical protein
MLSNDTAADSHAAFALLQSPYKLRVPSTLHVLPLRFKRACLAGLSYEALSRPSLAFIFIPRNICYICLRECWQRAQRTYPRRVLCTLSSGLSWHCPRSNPVTDFGSLVYQHPYVCTNSTTTPSGGPNIVFLPNTGWTSSRFSAP